MENSQLCAYKHDCRKYERSDRISVRRKALFPSDDGDSNDSDLGPMSPLSDTNSVSLNHISSSLKSLHSDSFQYYLSCGNSLSFESETDIYKVASHNKSSTPSLKSTPSRLSKFEVHVISPLRLSPMQSPFKSSCDSSLNNSGTIIYDTPLKESPTKDLKTPHDSTNLSTRLPKRPPKTNLDTSRNSIDQLVSSVSPTEKLDNSFSKNSKVRTALFPDISLPTKTFYPSVVNNCHKEPSIQGYHLEGRVLKHKSLPMYLCNRKARGKSQFGQINAGVRHKIRKPNQKKLIKLQAFKAALNIIGHSPINDYVQKLSQVQQISLEKSIFKVDTAGTNLLRDVSKDVSAQDVETHENPTSDEIRCSPPPDPNKRFFKSNRAKGIVTVNKNIKLQVSKGRMSLIEIKSKSKSKRIQNKIPLDASDLTVCENNGTISNNNILNILNVLDEKENCFGNLHKTVMENGNSINNNNDRKRKLAESTASESAELLLSPTSQMCDMASGLAINSPKRAKLNISKLLNDVPQSNSSVNVFNKTCTSDMEQQKLFPVFYLSNNVPSKPTKTVKNSNSGKQWKSLPDDQMLLDAGQKRFGATQCPECEIIYHMGDPSEELMHLNYHSAGNILRFNKKVGTFGVSLTLKYCPQNTTQLPRRTFRQPSWHHPETNKNSFYLSPDDANLVGEMYVEGWKHENVVANLKNGRVIKISQDDPKVWWKKINDLMEQVINRDLGFYDMKINIENSVVFLYIKNKCIVGCVVAEPKSQAFMMLPKLDGIDVCSEECYPIKCGISRIWVSKGHRKEGIGAALMNCVKNNFIFGYVLLDEDIALSSPTELGQIFATNYFKTSNYLIYTS